MSRKLALAVVLLAVLPALHLAWVARDMPHFGHLHDDSIYWVTAKSLAESKGYRILSLPAEPYQTKYPPLWPLALSALWRIDPRFPENLRLAMPVAWLMLPVFLALAWRWFRDVGFEIGPSAILCAVVGTSPWIVFLSTTLMSELIFSVLLLAAVIAIERAAAKNSMAFIAGLLAAAAYLTKTAALPLIAIGPLWLMLRRRRRPAAMFFCAMLPAVVAWTVWTRHHMTHAVDLVSLYYTNYLGYQIYNIGWRDLPLVVWKNLDGLFSGIAGLLIFDLAKSPAGIFLARLMAIGAIVGTVRFARRDGMTPYHWFALCYTAILLVWHFPPNERFLIPLFPLLLAGCATESSHLLEAWKKAWRLNAANRMAAAAMAAGAVALASTAIVWNAGAIFRQFPAIIGQHRAVLASNRAAFAWISRETPEAAFYAYDDPVFFLYTGRHAASLPVAPMPFYREDREAILRPFHNMAGFAREQQLDYLFFTAADFHRDLPPAERAEVRGILNGDNAFELVYRSPLSSVWRRKTILAASATPR
ncbi:MAG TPA: hypothetical protein VJN43_06325 [Bryobacteraceae bacterium]|nr:hypothetical protein [Bryobacteraceae bacterium]